MATKPRKSFVTPHPTRYWTVMAGLVPVPLSFTKMYDDPSSGRMSAKDLCPDHHEPISHNNVCTRLVKGKKVEHVVEKETVKGYEYQQGKFAILTKDEASSLKLNHDGLVTLVACINHDEAEEVQTEHHYWAFPIEDRTLPNFAAFLHFLEANNKALVGVGNWYGSTRAFIFVARDGVVEMHLGNYLANRRGAEVQTIHQISLPKLTKQQEKQADMFFGTLPAEMDWESVTDVVAERLNAAIDEKVKTGKVTAFEVLEPEEVDVDIFEVMREQMQKTAAASKRSNKRASAKRVKVTR